MAFVVAASGKKMLNTHQACTISRKSRRIEWIFQKAVTPTISEELFASITKNDDLGGRDCIKAHLRIHQWQIPLPLMVQTRAFAPIQPSRLIHTYSTAYDFTKSVFMTSVNKALEYVEMLSKRSNSEALIQDFPVSKKKLWTIRLRTVFSFFPRVVKRSE